MWIYLHGSLSNISIVLFPHTVWAAIYLLHFSLYTLLLKGTIIFSSCNCMAKFYLIIMVLKNVIIQFKMYSNSVTCPHVMKNKAKIHCFTTVSVCLKHTNYLLNFDLTDTVTECLIKVCKHVFQAVQEFGAMCQERQPDVVKGVLPYWPRIYCRISMVSI